MQLDDPMDSVLEDDMDIQKDTRTENLLDIAAVIPLDDPVDSALENDMDIQKDTRREDLLDTEADIAEDITSENEMDIPRDTRSEDLLGIEAVITSALVRVKEWEELVVTIDIPIVILGRFSNWIEFTF